MWLGSISGLVLEKFGSSVIAGHYGWKDGKAAAFDDLYKVKPGDDIYIEDDKGGTITFVVRESRLYNQDANAAFNIFF